MDAKIFNPSSIAIVGVSTETYKVGHLVAKNLIAQGYKGDIYFVNKKGGELFGKPVYRSLKDIKKPVDLVVLAMSVDIVLNLVDEINNLGIKNILIYAAGFKEVGGEGIEKERELFEKAQKYKMNILGPNCVGYINTEKNINLTFLRNKAPAGNIGVISQSGALGSLMLDYYNSHTNLGLSQFISLGNKTVIDESMALEFLFKDKKTEVIALYLEDVTDGEKFRKTLERITKVKPVVILKSGKTTEGAKAAMSHTGSLVGSDDVYQAIFDQSGAIRADNLDEFMLLLKIFSYKRIPRSEKVLVITNAGGVGVLLTDELIKNRLTMLTISEKTKDILDKKLFDSHKITIHNPIDLLGDAQANNFKIVMDEALKDKNIGSVIVLLTPQANTQVQETAKVIVDIQKDIGIPIFAIFLGGQAVEESLFYFEKEKITGFSSFNYLPLSIKKILKWSSYSKKAQENRDNEIYKLTILGNKTEIDLIFNKNKKNTFLSVMDSLDIFKLIDIPVASFGLIKNKIEIATVMKEIKFPVVLKINSEKISHKTEVQGVMPNIRNIKELDLAYEKLTKINGINGCLLQRMVKGTEFIVGAKRDHDFGVTIMFGLGGIYTEVLKQVVNLVYPFSYNDFLTSIGNTPIEKILSGFRGMGKIDTKNIYEILIKIALLMSRYENIKEIDINPLIASSKEIIAVDGRMVMSDL